MSLTLLFTLLISSILVVKAAEPSTTVAQGADLSEGLVDITGIFQIIPRDGDNTNVNEPDLNFMINFDSDDFTHLINYDSGSGVYEVEYRTTVAGKYSVSITLDDVPISGSPYTLVILPGDIDSAKSTFTGDGYLQFSTAGSTSSFGIEFKDSFENIVIVDESEIEFFVDYSDIIPNPPPIFRDFYSSGDQITFEYRSNQTGDLDLTVRLSNIQFWSGKITVIAGPIQESETIADLDVLIIPWPQAGTSGTIPIFAKDMFQNSVLPAFISSNPNQFQMAINLLDSNGDTLTSYLFNSTLDGPIEEATGYVINFNPLTIAGNYSLSIVREGKHISGSPTTFRVIPSDIDGTKTEILKNFTSSERVGDTFSFKIVARDTYGNKRISGGETENFLVEIFSDTDVVTTQISDDNNGEYTVTYQFPSSGRYVIDAFFFLDALIGSGQTINAFSETSSSLSEARGDGLSSCKISTTCRFIIQVRDQFDNNQTGTSDIVTISVGRKTPKYSVTPLGQGIYAVEYTGTSGSKLNVFVNEEHIKNSPFSVYMAPSDGAVGVIVAIFIILAVAIALACYIIYKRKQISKMRKEWELKKAMAYKEYQTDQAGPPVPLNNSLAQVNEPEWEDDEYPDGLEHGKHEGDDSEWKAMSQWVKPAN